MLAGTGVSIHCVWDINDSERLMVNVIDFRATSHDNKYFTMYVYTNDILWGPDDCLRDTMDAIAYIEECVKQEIDRRRKKANRCEN